MDFLTMHVLRILNGKRHDVDCEVRNMMKFNNSKKKQRIAAIIVIVIIVAMVLGTVVSALYMY